MDIKNVNIIKITHQLPASHNGNRRKTLGKCQLTSF